MEIPGAVRLLVVSGADILVEPAAGAAVEDAAAFIVGTGLAIACYQRGALLLHASAVASGTRAYAFVGASGAGKSTLAALLCWRGGCDLVSDDVATIDLVEDTAVLCPDGRQLRLWQDVIELLVLQAQRREPVRSMLRKYHVAASARHGEVRPSLAAVYLLDELAAPGEPIIEPVPLVQAAPLLQNNLYRRAFAKHVAQQGDGFMRIARLLGCVQVYRLQRCVSPESNDRVVSRLQAHWETLQ
jgi:hypothetical protein